MHGQKIKFIFLKINQIIFSMNASNDSNYGILFFFGFTTGSGLSGLETWTRS